MIPPSSQTNKNLRTGSQHRRLLDVQAASLPPTKTSPPSLADATAPAPGAAAPKVVTGEEEEEDGPPVNGQRAINTEAGSSPLAAVVLGAVGGIHLNSSVFYTPLTRAQLGDAATMPLAFQPRQRGWTPPKMSEPSTVRFFVFFAHPSIHPAFPSNLAPLTSDARSLPSSITTVLPRRV